MALTIPAWLQRSTVPADTANLQKSLAGLQESFAAEGSTIPILYGPFQIGGRPFVIVYNSGTSTFTVGVLIGRGPIQSIDNVWLDGAAPVGGVTVTNHVGSLSQAVDSVIATAAGAGYTDTLIIPAGDGIPSAIPLAYISIQFTTTHYKAWPTIVIEGKGSLGKDPSNPTAPDAYLTYPTLYLYDFITRVMNEPIDDLSAIYALNANKAFVGTTGLPRRTGGVIIDEAQAPQDWIDILRMYAGCWAFKRGGTWVLVPDTVRAVDKALTAGSFLKETFTPYLADSSIVPTVVRIIHSVDGGDPLWIEETAISIDPEVTAGTKPRLESFVRMPGIQNYREAQWEAQERRRKLALGLTFTGVVADENCVIEEGDVVTVDHWRLDKQYSFRITEAKMVGRGRKRISGTEYDATVYDVLAGSDYAASSGDSGVVGVIVTGGGNTYNTTNNYINGGPTVYNPNFELGDTGWTKGNASCTIQGTNTHRGSYSLRVTGNAGTPATRNDTGYPCRAGDRFVVGGYIMSDVSWVATSAYVRVSWRDSGYTEIATSVVEQQTGNGTHAWAEYRSAVVAPASAEFAVCECVVISQTAGNCYFDDCFMEAQTGAKIGEDLYSVGGVLMNAADLQNDSLVTAALGAINPNPTFEIPRTNVAGTKSPAMWWRWNSGNYIRYDNDTNMDVIRILASDAIVIANAAQRVNPDTQYEISVLAKMVSGTGNIYIRVCEYDTDLLPTGKRAIGGGTAEAEVQTSTREPLNSGSALTTSYAIYKATYVPTATAKWWSINLLWTSTTGDVLVEWCIARTLSTKNDGDLADLNTVGTTHIDAGAVTSIANSNPSTYSGSSLSTTYTEVASISVTCIAGQPVRVWWTGWVNRTAGGWSLFDIQLSRGSSVTAPDAVLQAVNDMSVDAAGLNLTVLIGTETPGAGTFTYKVSVKFNGAGNSIDIYNQTFLVDQVKR